ncbi:MAG TPA: DEAD/DEAH box helicase, partial [Myxococcaceae bacterium]|nr:DEAD/DEAH box helicase [Myxococcaceae bacterium]
MSNDKTSGPGGSDGRRGDGRGRGSFGDRGRGPRGPGDPRGRGPGDRRGRGREDRRGEFGGASHRVLSELPALEKALSSSELSKQKTSLEAILKALRPMRLKSFEDLDANTRGRLLTTLVRVQRQPRPANLDELQAEKP